MDAKKKTLRCSQCKKKGRGVRRRVDPFMKEIHDVIRRKNLCGACFQEHLDSI